MLGEGTRPVIGAVLHPSHALTNTVDCGYLPAMATTTIKKSKLAALEEHIRNDGDNDLETVALLLGLEPDDEEGVAAYVAHLKGLKPELFGEAPAAPVEASTTPTSYQLLDGDILRDLEVVKQKGTALILQTKVPRDLVTVRLQGKDVELDILELQRADQSELRHGFAVSTLLTIARAAK